MFAGILEGGGGKSVEMCRRNWPEKSIFWPFWPFLVFFGLFWSFFPLKTHIFAFLVFAPIEINIQFDDPIKKNTSLF